jgi:hypothetical protein
VDFGTSASSSQKQSTAENFAKENTKGEKVGLLMKLTLKTGRDLLQFSEVKSEAEITILPGVKFIVTQLSPPDEARDYYIAEMAEQ